MLYYKHLRIALVEAKDQSFAVGSGMQQALEYAATLDIPYVVASNVSGFQFYDRTGVGTPKEQTLTLTAFPGPEELWARYQTWKGLRHHEHTRVLDTKWKRIDQSLNNAREKFGLSQADFYQLLAYGERYMRGVGEMLLVYPMTRTFCAPLALFA